MTKDAYFEMCEMMGSEPIDSEIPVDYEDFPIEVQETINIYNKLQDNWDYFNGNYIGKNYAGLMDIFTLLEVADSDRRHTYDLIGIIDAARSKIIQDSKKK